jgi:dTMP kinase
MEGTRGVLITLEGVDGCGKSTQARLLAGRLEADGHKVVAVREPGSTVLAERVRNILLDPELPELDPRAELFLYVACRAQLIRDEIAPAIASGAVVVSDRYSDSTLAYQGYGRELGYESTYQAVDAGTGGLWPDLTFLVDTPLEIAKSRRAGTDADRMEQEDVRFHERVREGFLEIARREPDRVMCVDGTRTPGVVADEVHEELFRRFPLLTR